MVSTFCSELAQEQEYDTQGALIMRTGFFLILVLVFLCTSRAVAQPSPYGSLDGNLGTWKWSKPQASTPEEDNEREPGETSWERLNAERDAEETELRSKEPPEGLTPLQLWRLLRGQNRE